MDGKCEACGKSVLFIKEAIYDGFTKTGEVLKCSQCGHVVEGEEAEAVTKKPDAPSIFTEADRSAPINLFEEGENRVLCRYCLYYVVNPFTQRCTKHEKEVAATDTCFDFEERVEEEADEVSGEVDGE